MQSTRIKVQPAMASARKDTNKPITSVGLTRFFFASRRRHTRCSRDWSSDVCSSDLPGPEHDTQQYEGAAGGEDRVEAGQVAPPDGRQPRREQADRGQARERENRTHVHVANIRERLTPAQAAA